MFGTPCSEHSMTLYGRLNALTRNAAICPRLTLLRGQ